jgi:hypothetical protein
MIAKSMTRSLAVAVAAAAASMSSQAAANPSPPLRHCVLLAGEHATAGPTSAEQDRAVGINARLANSLLLPLLRSDRLVANELIVDDGVPLAVDAHMRAARLATGCDTVIEFRHVLWRTSIGDAFGFDVDVWRAGADGATLSSIYQREYRYALSQAAATSFSYSGFAAQAWAELHATGILDVDHEAAPPAPAAVRAAYDRWVASWPQQGVPQYHVRHIRRSTEALAAAMLARVRDQHADFATVARESSDDAESAKAGGDIGWVSLSGLPSELASAVREKAAGGLVAHPVHSPYGWHVVEVLGERAGRPPEFAEVRDVFEASQRWDAVVPAADWKAALAR